MPEPSALSAAFPASLLLPPLCSTDDCVSGRSEGIGANTGHFVSVCLFEVAK